MVFVSDPKLIAGVEQFLGQINKIANLDYGTFYRLLVASTEAVNNAILHGNKSDVSKEVFISCQEFQISHLEFSISALVYQSYFCSHDRC